MNILNTSLPSFLEPADAARHGKVFLILRIRGVFQKHCLPLFACPLSRSSLFEVDRFIGCIGSIIKPVKSLGDWKSRELIIGAGVEVSVFVRESKLFVYSFSKIENFGSEGAYTKSGKLIQSILAKPLKRVVDVFHNTG